MNTDRLIDMLSTNVEPVRPRQIERTLALAVTFGTVAALCVMVVTVSWRPDLGEATALGFVALKLFFALAVAAAGLAALVRFAYPGRERRGTLHALAIPFAALSTASLVVLAMTPAPAWHRMTMGTQWWMCLYCIPLFAVGPFALLIWALGKAAPTDLRRTGAVAGLVAGAIGALAYALHCPDDSIPFVAVWYGLSIGACGLAGSRIALPLLRW